MTDNSWASEVAAGLADGTRIEWDELEKRLVDPASRSLLRTFRRLEAAILVHAKDQEALLLPTRWGHLDLLDEIGHGTSGDVYRARDSRLDRIVALKLLRRTSHEAEADSLRLSEARMLARVNHPNVVAVYGTDCIDGRVGIWMEYVEGSTLAERVKTCGPLSAEEATEIGLAVCSALSAVHGAGLLHRDVKAQNILVANNGRIVLTDFGEGRELAESVGAISPVGAGLAGTPLYLAPELLAGAMPSKKSEVYSLGVLLYHLVTGQFPNNGRSLKELRESHRAGNRLSVQSLVPDLGSRLALTIDTASHPDPAARYSDVETLGLALRDTRRKRGKTAALLRSLFASEAALRSLDRVLEAPRRDGGSYSSVGHFWRLVSLIPALTATALVAALREVPAISWTSFGGRLALFWVLPALVLSTFTILARVDGSWLLPTVPLAIVSFAAAHWQSHVPLGLFLVGLWPVRTVKAPAGALALVGAALAVALALGREQFSVVQSAATIAAQNATPFADSYTDFSAEYAGVSARFGPARGLMVHGVAAMAAALLVLGHAASRLSPIRRATVSIAGVFVYHGILVFGSYPLLLARLSGQNSPALEGYRALGWAVAVAALVTAAAMSSPDVGEVAPGTRAVPKPST